MDMGKSTQQTLIHFPIKKFKMIDRFSFMNAISEDKKIQ